VPGSDFKAPGNPLYLIGRPAHAFGGSVYQELFGLPDTADSSVPRTSTAALATYKALHRAIAAGTVKACHDLSDGGLAAALAEMCLGGSLGASVTVGGATPGGAQALLFGETNGCLVAEVDASKAADFEKAMAGIPRARIGSTNGSGRLELDADGLKASIPAGELKAAFMGTRSGQ
jgi:phosphoribosylformylglycinamidine synthase